MILKEVNVSVSDVVEILDDVEFREGNMNIYKLIFSMSEKLKELTSVAVFTTDTGEVYKTAVIDGICYVPFKALKYGTTELGVYSYKENELIHSPAPTDFFVGKGSYKEGSLTEEEFVLSDYERYLVLNQQILNEMKALASGGVTGKEIDPTVPQHVKDITEQDIEKWNKGVGGEAGKSAYDLWLENGNTGTIDDFFESLKGDEGKSGVYVGSGEMPEDCNVQIDPDGEIDIVVKTVNGEKPDENGNVEIELPKHEEVEMAVQKIEKTSADNTSTIEPNVFYVFPEMSNLEIVLGGEIDSSIVQEYKFRFTSGNTATTLILPDTVIGELTVEANKIYEISIIDNLLVSQSWEVS